MTFGIGRGFADVQILKTVKFNSETVWIILIKILQIHWYWQDLAQGIAKHLSSVDALPSAKFWKIENGSISSTEWNILINFFIHIDIYKI